MIEPSQQSINPSDHGTEDRLPLSCDKNDSNSKDEVDVLTPDANVRIKAAIEQFQAKVVKTKEAIKAEQTLRDEIVDEYLKLASNADEAQNHRIKSSFEKKNQKSAHAIAQLQRKLDKYTQKLREIEKLGIHALHQPSRSRTVIANVVSGFKDVSSNIRDGITGISEGVIGTIKPSQSSTPSSANQQTSHSIRESPGVSRLDTTNDTSSTFNHEDGDKEDKQPEKHGSYTQGSSSFYVHSYSHSTKPTSDENSSITSDENLQLQRAPLYEGAQSGQIDPLSRNRGRFASRTGSSNNIIDSQQLAELIAGMRDRENESQRLSEELRAFKMQYSEESSVFTQALQEEKFKSDLLEDHLNDLIELHQKEIENLKQNIYDIEEKILYQSEERLRDIYDTLESCQTRISRIEHQQHQQQLVNLNSLEDSNAKALALKLINVVLTVLHIILLLVATVSSVVTPLTRTRIFLLGFFLLLTSILMKAREGDSDVPTWLRKNLRWYFPRLFELLPDTWQ